MYVFKRPFLQENIEFFNVFSIVLQNFKLRTE